MAENNVELLQHELDRFGIVTVADAVMYADDVPVLRLDTLKISNISSESQNKQIKGGQFADMLLYYAYGRSVNVEFQDALISWKAMQELWGAVKNTDVFTLHKVETLIVKNISSALKVTLAFPANETGLVVLNKTTGDEISKKNATASPAVDGWALADNVLTLDAAVADEDDVLEIFYTYNSDDADVEAYTPTELILKSTSFPRTVKFVGTSFILEQRTGKRVAVEIEIPKLKLDGAFTLTMEAEGDASVFDFKGMALINENRELVKIKTIGYLD